jgi:hypothetical protein
LFEAGKTKSLFEKSVFFFPAPQLFSQKLFRSFIGLHSKPVNSLKRFERQEMGSGEKP